MHVARDPSVEQAGRYGTCFASYACVRCSTRKVKCEKQLPRCQKCVAAQLECQYITPAAPRRKRRSSGTLSHARIKGHEVLSRVSGDHVESVPETDRPILKATETEATYPMVDNPVQPQSEQKLPGRNDRAFGENELWSNLTDLQPSIQVQTSAETDIWYTFRGSAEQNRNAPSFDPTWDPRPFINLAEYWPSPATARTLWQTYKENFMPLAKIVHAPSVEKLICDDTRSFTECSSAEQALLCAIFATAIYTMSDDECKAELREDRSILLQSHRSAARCALFSANFLVSRDLTVIQAFVMFLISLRHDYDASPLWTLAGTAIRNGKRIGLDRLDDLTPYSPFEREVRKWVWFNLLYFDAWMAEVAGSRKPWAEFDEGFQIPSNLNDEDIDPTTTKIPLERDGATDVMFTLLRCDWVKAQQETRASYMSTGMVDPSIVNEVEETFTRKYLRHCDPTIPMHFLLLLTVKIMIANLRLSAHRPRSGERSAITPSQQAEADRSFEIAVKTLEYDSMAQNTQSLQKFRWHFHHHMPRMAIILVLSELRYRTSGREVDKAWLLIEDIFAKNSELISSKYRQLFWAMGSLVIDAWERREESHQGKSVNLPQPSFISQLRAERMRPSSTAPQDDHEAYLLGSNVAGPAGSASLSSDKDAPPPGNAMNATSPDVGVAYDDPPASRSGYAMDWFQWGILTEQFDWSSTDAFLELT